MIIIIIIIIIKVVLTTIIIIKIYLIDLKQIRQTRLKKNTI